MSYRDAASALDTWPDQFADAQEEAQSEQARTEMHDALRFAIDTLRRRRAIAYDTAAERLEALLLTEDD